MSADHDHADPDHTDHGGAEHERLEQELLELHFDCHPDPEPLRARLAAEPALRELQRRALATAAVLQRAAVPQQAPLALPTAPPGATAFWPSLWRRPLRRLLTLGTAAALLVGAFAAVHAVRCAALARVRAEQCRITLCAPRAVPVGAPWSFTVDAEDLAGGAVTGDVHWRAFADDGRELAAGTAPLRGRSTVAMTAGLAPPRQLEVTAVHPAGRTVQSLRFEAGAAVPLVHVTTDKPVYRPGEPVFVRAVALDRCTLQPAPAAARLAVTIRDARGGLVFQENGGSVAWPTAGGPGGAAPAPAPEHGSGVAAALWQVPAESAGGEHTIEVTAWDGTLPTERLTFVVRPFEQPRLAKTIALDRTTYAPGQRGSAEVAVTRLGSGAAAGATVRGSLLVDGNEVWSATATLDARGKATFAFAVPATVGQGAARFLAQVTDGGVVETEVKPFVVPTGEVLAAVFPEGGELVADVENRVYLELTDRLGRPVDGVGAIVDARGEHLAEFVTAHQGRARVAFVPERTGEYRLVTKGLPAPLPLPAVRATGIALRPLGDALAAGEPVRVHLAGRGDGPWLVGVFCRGVLLGQSTVRPDDRGELDRDVAIDVPAATAGVLRVTVFDRRLQPVAERLLQRRSAQRLDLAIAPAAARLTPGDRQQVTVTATDEQGQPVAGAALAVCVTDGSTLALASEPRVSLLEQTLLFADCERIEDLGSVFAAGEHAARNVDLLLGTRGWRRFVWRNDEAAKAAIAGAGDWGKDQLRREGFAQDPQVVDNSGEALLAVAAPAEAVRRSRADLATAAGGAALVLLLGVLAELVRWLWRQRVVVQVAGYSLLGSGAAVLVTLLLQGPPQAELALGELPPGAGRFAGDAGGLAVFAEAVKAEAAKPGAGGFVGHDEFFLGATRRARGAALGEQPPADGKAPARGRVGFDAKLEEEIGDVRDFRVGALVFQPQYREYAHRRTSGETRTDFTGTVAWYPLLVTDARGAATIAFDTSDAVTTWVVSADGHGQGRVGSASGAFTAQLPLRGEARLPAEVSAGDRLLLPVAIEQAAGGETAAVEVALTGPLALQGPAQQTVPLTGGRGRALLPIDVQDEAGLATIAIASRSGRFADTIRRDLVVVPRGFPQRRSSGGVVRVGTPATAAIALPAASVRGSGQLLLRLFPSPLVGMAQGLQGLLQEPCGCFEQASSSNYPNVMVLGYLEASGDDVPALAARARELLPRGYQRITGYECKERGYEWFGGDPGHEALTAYGLLQFTDMRKVSEVDAAMVGRTQAWLLSRRDGNGGYRRNDRALDSFGRAPQQVTDAYVTYALLTAGTAAKELAQEIDAVAARATSTADAYELALCAGALARAGHAGAAAARQRLSTLQQADGSLRGSTTSITSSGGNDLTVETTAWAVLAFLAEPATAAAARKACDFLQQQRTANGTFGATQATICALQALTAYAERSRAIPAAGSVSVFVGDRRLGECAFAKGQQEPIEFSLWAQLPPGEHALRIELASEPGVELPWALDLAYHAELPADDPETAVLLATRLAAERVDEGRTVALEVLLQNRTQDGLPMALARIGLPAGLEVPTRVLDDCKRAGAFDLWELRGRELVLYWRSLAPAAERRVRLDAVAVVPGTTTGAASSGYLYYTPQQRRWAVPLRIEVTPSGGR